MTCGRGAVLWSGRGSSHLDPRTPPAVPSAERLEASVLRLAAAGEVRTLVGVVERWSQVAEPTQRALLAQIEGFLDLCMMDRAWTRLQGLPDVDALRRERTLLTARMFIDRGWPRRARRLVDEALALWPDDADLLALSAGADAPPRRAPVADPDLDAPYAELLGVAETWLATGAFLKAHRLLEQLQRRHPSEKRPSELLWALKGDYDLQGTTLAAVVTSWAGAEEPEPEPHAEAVVSAPGSAVSSSSSGSFPDLFGSHGEDRRGDSAYPARDEETAEITQATRLSDLAGAASFRAMGAEDRDEDTQVLRIVNHGTDGATFAPRAVGGPRGDRGPATSPGIREELEGEDEAVIQLTRMHDHQPPVEMKRAPTLPDPGPPRRAPTPLADLPEVQPEAEVVGEAEPLPRWIWVMAAALAVVGVALGLVAAWTAGFIG